MTFKKFFTPVLILIVLFGASQSFAKKKEKAVLPEIDSAVFSNLKYRNIGPFRGGRSAAVCGVSDNPDLYYFGSTGGGVWKTTDGGTSWQLQNYQPSKERPFLDLYFSDENNGVAIGAYGLFYRTSDGGKNWAQEFHLELLNEECNFRLTGIYKNEIIH